MADHDEKTDSDTQIFFDLVSIITGNNDVEEFGLDETDFDKVDQDLTQIIDSMMMVGQSLETPLSDRRPQFTEESIEYIKQIKKCHGKRKGEGKSNGNSKGKGSDSKGLTKKGFKNKDKAKDYDEDKGKGIGVAPTSSPKSQSPSIKSIQQMRTPFPTTSRTVATATYARANSLADSRTNSKAGWKADSSANFVSPISFTTDPRCTYTCTISRM